MVFKKEKAKNPWSKGEIPTKKKQTNQPQDVHQHLVKTVKALFLK
jgi:hypothetical protein